MARPEDKISLDSLIPHEHLCLNQRKYPARFEGEYELMAAILEDAAECFHKYAVSNDRRELNLFCDAKAWFFEPRSVWIFSFESVCDYLGHDPDYIRKGLAALENQIRANPPDINQLRDSRNLRKRKYYAQHQNTK